MTYKNKFWVSDWKSRQELEKRSATKNSTHLVETQLRTIPGVNNFKMVLSSWMVLLLEQNKEKKLGKSVVSYSEMIKMQMIRRRSCRKVPVEETKFSWRVLNPATWDLIWRKIDGSLFSVRKMRQQVGTQQLYNFNASVPEKRHYCWLRIGRVISVKTGSGAKRS